MACKKAWAAGVTTVGSLRLQDILSMAVTPQLWEQWHKTQNSIPSGTRVMNEQCSCTEYSTAQSQPFWHSFSCLIYYTLHKSIEIIDSASLWVKLCRSMAITVKWWIFPAELDVTLYRRRHTHTYTHMHSPCRNRQKSPLNGLQFMKCSYSFTDSCNKNTRYFVLLYSTLKICVSHKEIISTIKFLVQKISKILWLSTFKKQVSSPKISGHSISWQLLVWINFIKFPQESSYVFVKYVH